MLTSSDLRATIEVCIQIRALLNGLHSRYEHGVVEQAMLGGALDAGVLSDLGRANDIAAKVAERLDAVAEETERGWAGRTNPSNEGMGGFVFERMVRGVKEAQILDANLIQSADARALHGLQPRLNGVFVTPPILRSKDKSEPVSGPLHLLDLVFESARKGLTLQRYKGLGEMDAEQLWETTLDPDARSLLQVKVNDATDADSLFSRLMGDEVEPRREFIQDNALSVANLDI